MVRQSLSERRSNAHKIASILDEYGLCSRVRSFDAILQRVKALSPHEINEILERIFVNSKFEAQPISTPFTFVGTQQLAGAPSPCESAKCRLSSLDDLGRFAALYADHVYVPNPLGRVFRITDPARCDELFRYEVAVGFAIIAKLRPLINAGLVSFVEVEFGGLCPSCFDRAWQKPLEKSASAKNPTTYLISRFNKETTFTVEKLSKDGRCLFGIKVPESLITCGGFVFEGNIKDLPLSIKEASLPTILDDAQATKKHSAVNNVIQQIVSDIKTQTTLTKRLGASYLIPSL